MDRITKSFGTIYSHCGVSNFCERSSCYYPYPCEYQKLYSRILEIEDILGDTYDLDRLRELVQADQGGRCVVLPVKPGSVVRCVNGESGKKEIVDRITIYAGGRMTYGFHEFDVKVVHVDEWSEDEAENYVPVENMG